MKQNGRGGAYRGILEEVGNFYTILVGKPEGRDFLDDVVLEMKTIAN